MKFFDILYSGSSPCVYFNMYPSELVAERSKLDGPVTGTSPVQTVSKQDLTVHLCQKSLSLNGVKYVRNQKLYY